MVTMDKLGERQELIDWISSLPVGELSFLLIYKDYMDKKSYGDITVSFQGGKAALLRIVHTVKKGK